jgi:hypothetical protein
MFKVMPAFVERDFRLKFERQYCLDRDGAQDAMNALRRDLWEEDRHLPRAVSAIAPSVIARGLFGVN